MKELASNIFAKCSLFLTSLRLIASFKASDFKRFSLVVCLYIFAEGTERRETRLRSVSIFPSDEQRFQSKYESKFKRLNTHHFSSLVTNEARDICECKKKNPEYEASFAHVLAGWLGRVCDVV